MMKRTRRKLGTLLLAAAMAVGILTAAPITAYAATPVINTPAGALVGGMVGVPYVTNVLINQGVLYTGTQISSGALPDGLSIDTTSSGTNNVIYISGTPSEAGTFVFELTVTNANDETSAPVQYSINIVEDARIIVGFGGQEWCVIAGGGNGLNVAPEPGTMTLLAKDHAYGATEFHNSSTKYNGSTLQTHMASAAALPEGEQTLIKPRTLVGYGDNNSPSEMDGEDAIDQLFWPLSKNEHAALTNGERTFPVDYWLRSSHTYNIYILHGLHNGSAARGEGMATYLGIRPAFHLNLSSVLFTSGAADGKSSEAGATLSSSSPPANFYKFTVVDDGAQAVTVVATTAQSTQSVPTNEPLSFSYRDATTGTGQRVSCILEDANGVTHYGFLADSSNAANGTLSILASDIADGVYTLRIFSEQVNGTNSTDFASTPVNMTLTIAEGTCTVRNFDGTVLSDDAELSTVAGQPITAGSEEGTATAPKTAGISVGNDVSAVGLSDIAANHSGATVELYSDSGFSQDKDEPIELNVGNNNHLYIKVVSEDGTATLQYDVAVTRTTDFPFTPTGTYQRTLTDKATGVTVSGEMKNGARLSVREASLHGEGSCPACDEIRARQAAGELIILYDISVTGGYTGSLEVSIPVGSQYDGQTVAILHCMNGTLESVTCTVQNGVAKGTFKGLSPFAVFSEPEPWDNPFEDVFENDWFYGDVEHVFVNGLFYGTSATTFSPQLPMSRAMLATVLYRTAGEPSVAGPDNPFTDVEDGAWYTNAVIWAVRSGIVEGYGTGMFGPDDPITREDLCVMLLRYTVLMDISLPQTLPAQDFADAGEIADYAKEAVIALYRAEIIEGKDKGVFDPKGSTTRAEVAAMLRRYLELV